MRTRLLPFFWLLLPPSLIAQRAPTIEVHPDYAVRQWTVEDGLPMNAIRDLVQDDEGFLWMAMNEGIVRFDGQRFSVFNATNTPGLPGNRIKALLKDSDGQILVRGEQDDVVPLRDGRPVALGAHVDLLSGVRNLSMQRDTLWIATTHGVVRSAGGHSEPYRPDLFGERVEEVRQDRRGRLWVLDASGLRRLDPDGRVRRVEIDALAPPAGRLHESRDGAIWVLGNHGAVRVDQDRAERVYPSQVLGGYFHQDVQGGVWLSVLGGWVRWDPSGAVTKHPGPALQMQGNEVRTGPDGRLWQAGFESGRAVLLRDGELVYTAGTKIATYLFDPDGSVWIATGNEGLVHLTPAVLTTFSEPEGLPYSNVYAVLQDRQGSVWIGAPLVGLARIDTSGRVAAIAPDPDDPLLTVLTLLEDHTGRIWAGGGTLCRVEGERCLNVRLPLPLSVAGGFRAMLEDSRGRFWLGGQNGLVLGLPQGDSLGWTRVQSVEGLLAHGARVLLETRDGSILIGTNGGGVLRTLDGGELEVLTTADGLASDFVRDLYEDAEGFLWIVLEDRGLCRVDRRGGIALSGADVVCIDSRSGLYWDGLHRLIEDDSGRFWFNSNAGIFWIMREALQAYFTGEIPAVSSVSYTEADGMRNREGNGGSQPAGDRARDGRLWFPTQEGVVVIDPSEVPVPEPLARLYDVRVGRDQRPATGRLELSPDEPDVVFRYGMRELIHPEDVRFLVRLVGYDDTWLDAGTAREATYTNLPPGDYTFQVRAGLGGLWSEPASLAVHRAPFVWQSVWFRVLAALVLLGLGPLFYALRVRRFEAREAELEHAVAERTAQVTRQAEELRVSNEMKSHFLANISHEFRTPLTLTFGPIHDALAGRFSSFAAARPHFERASLNGRRLLRLINQLLDLSRLEADAVLLHPRRYDLADFVRRIAALFESVAARRNQQFTTHLPNEPFPHVFDAEQIEKVVVNLLSNAFKFTPRGGKISVAVDLADNDAARIVVADTGPGIPAEHLPYLFDRFYQVESGSTRSQEGSGIGLALVKELVEMHGGAIEVESRVGFGTRVTVMLPRMTDQEGAEPDHRIPATSEAPVPESVPDELMPSDARAPESEAAVSEKATVVLVVDDHAGLRAYIRAHLDRTCTVIEAENGAEGLNRARDLVPDLVLTDVMMPEMDGLALCAALKADVRTSHVPVVMLSSKGEVEHRIEGYESGADAYLPKPFDAEELQVRVRTLIEERRRLRARFAGSAPPEADGAEAADPVLPARELAFLEQARSIIHARLSVADFGVERLADELAMSRRQLFRKLDALTDETPAALIRRLRLERAAALLREEGHTVKEVCFEVGFESQSSFARAFRQRYGISPSEYARNTSE